MAERTTRGFGLVTAATALAGIGGYAITAIAVVGLDPVDYSEFAVFWGALFLSVGALSGIQQEFSRASTSTTDVDVDRRSRATRTRSALALAVLGGIAVAMLIVPIVAALFPRHVVGFGSALVAGAAATAVIALLTGVAYGVGAWRVVAIVIVGDVALRLVFIVVALMAGGDSVALAWATVLPYPFVLAFLWFASRRRRAGLDVNGRTLALHLLSTVGAAIGTAALVSGAPLLIGIAAGTDAETIGPLVFALTLTRAPLVVVVLALQSFLVVWFRGHRNVGTALLRVTAVVLGGGAAFALVVFLVGDPVIVLIAGEGYSLGAGLLTWLVVASLCTALLGVTGAAALSLARHTLYVVGWSVSAVLAVLALLLLPLPLSERVVLGLAIGPLVGIGIHLLAFGGAREAPHGEDPGSDARESE